MRKAIALIFLVIGVLCVAVLYGPTVSLIPDAIANQQQGELPIELISSIANQPQSDLPISLQYEAPQITVSLSHTGHFYDETISVSLSSSSPNAAIYYTTDGSAPSTNDNLYTQPLQFTADEKLQCIVLKAIAIDGFNISPVLTHTYFIGQFIDERFSTYVFSISTDHDNLYGDEYGILVSGKIYNDFMEENPDTDLWWGHRPHNFYMRGWEWERPGHMEVFTQDGERVIAQNTGIRTQGNAGRVNPQKSLRLTARRMYSPEAGRFHGEIFQDYYSHSPYPNPILAYNSIILRSENDLNNITTVLGTQIAREAGYSAATPFAPGCVFINGEYYGYASVNLRFDEQFLQSLYDAPDRDFEILQNEGHEYGSSASEESREALDRLMEYAEQGFVGEQIEALHDLFDVDDLLLHYAIHIYVGNRDWRPFDGRNVRLWRYVGVVGDSNPVKELDGRWRYDMYDLDNGLGRGGSPSNSKQAIIYKLDEDLLFRSIVQHPVHLEYAEQFANYLCDMAFEHFSASNIERVYSELIGMYLDERLMTASQEKYDEYFERITDYAERRPDYILPELRELFGYTDMYHIVSDGSAKINTLNGNEGAYFVENRVPIAPILEKGHILDHWLVNGEKRYDENLLVSFGDADDDGMVFVSLVSREGFAPLLFKDTYDMGTLFGFTMHNPNSATQNTQGLYLSDNIEDLRKWAFPDFDIRPGGTWEFVGRSSTSLDALLKIQLNFNPRLGEVVFLSNEDGVVLDWIAMKP